MEEQSDKLVLSGERHLLFTSEFHDGPIYGLVCFYLDWQINFTKQNRSEAVFYGVLFKH